MVRTAQTRSLHSLRPAPEAWTSGAKLSQGEHMKEGSQSDGWLRQGPRYVCDVAKALALQLFLELARRWFHTW